METRTLHLPPEETPQFLEQFLPKKHFRIRSLWVIFGATASAIILFLIISAFLMTYYENKMVARITYNGMPLQNKTYNEVLSLLETKTTENYPEYTIEFSTQMGDQTQVFATSSAWLEFTIHTKETADTYYEIGHSGNWWTQLIARWDALSNPIEEISVPLSYNAEKAELWKQTIAQSVLIEGSDPKAIWNPNHIQFDIGSYGQSLDSTAFNKTISDTIGKSHQAELPIIVTHTPLSADAQILTETRLQTLHNETITLTVSDDEPEISLTGKEFFPWIVLPTGFDLQIMTTDLSELTQFWNRDPINALFEQDENGELTTFQPDRSGRTVLTEELAQRIQSDLSNPERAEEDSIIMVPVQEQAAEISLAETNTLGIVERIGVGTSTFYGSIPNRVHNVAITGEKLNATLVPAGEEFSFNKSIGPVDRNHGYKAAYVIQNGRTVLGDGGGVCQASTTTFRAILNAGLPITQWKAHSYRVGYYEQNEKPGFDATVYSPSVDLKFKNDTGHAVVITSTVDVDNRHFLVEIWGTHDGRESIISDYTSWNQRSAPAPLYQEDPSLPRGVTKQVDWAAPGLNTRFTYTVKNADGTERSQRDFTSVFRPWQAVYLVGTGN